MKKISILQTQTLIQSVWVALICACMSWASCQKYLDAKPNQTIATPTTIADLQGILNNYNFINARFPSAGEVASDNYYLNTANFNSLIERQQMFYTWQKYDDIGGDYSSPYGAIEYANIIIDALPKIQGGDIQTRNTILGSALFVRASFHFSLTQLFAKPYIEASASADLGIALRLTSDITVKPLRSSVADNYNAILTDLRRSVQLLPQNSAVKYLPGKCAAYGMLARVCLSMSDYTRADLYADSALKIYSTLIDYNTVSATATIPFTQFNDEVIYDARTSQPSALALAKAYVDTALYASYDSNDLRKALYFKNSGTIMLFKPNYSGQNNGAVFTGIATDELYLTKAEALARSGNTSGGLSTLNALLVKRYKTGTFTPYQISDNSQLLATILNERRKELIYRGTRWTDLRRLNQEPGFATTLTRNVNGVMYQLPPGSPRYVFEIDQNAVNISGLTQNP